MPLNKTCQQADSVKLARHSKKGEHGSYKTSKTLAVEKIQPFLSPGKMPQKVIFITIISQYHKTNVEDRKLPASCIPWPLPSFRCTAMVLNKSTDITMWKRKKERQLRSIEMHFLASTRFCKVQNNIAEVCVSTVFAGKCISMHYCVAIK